MDLVRLQFSAAAEQKLSCGLVITGDFRELASDNLYIFQKFNVRLSALSNYMKFIVILASARKLFLVFERIKKISDYDKLMLYLNQNVK